MSRQANLLYEFGPFRLDTRERLLSHEGEAVPLTPKVFDTLLVLVQNSGHILGKEEIMKLVWPDATVEEGSLTRNISTLRKALGESLCGPLLGESPGGTEYIETIPWRGYRFVAAVREVKIIESIAILPFINESADADLEYLPDGITESIIDKLTRLPDLKVMSRNSVFRYKNQQADANVVGRELNVHAVLTGRVAERAGHLFISVELVDAEDNSRVWGAQYKRKLIDILAMQEAISQDIAESLRLKIAGEDRRRLTRHDTDNPEAYHLYLKGRYHWNKLTVEGVQKGIEHFRQAIEKDPSYALAYIGLTDCYSYIGDSAAAKAAVRKALELDATRGEAHASLGFFKFVYDWDWAGAEEKFKRAIVLSPNYAQAHHWYAIYLANMGRHDEAIIEAQRAQELDPLSLLMNMTLALTSFLARCYDRAIEELQKIIEMEENFGAAHSVLGAVYEQNGMYEKSLAEHWRALEILGKQAEIPGASVKANIGHVYATWGKRREAIEILDELSKWRDVLSYSLASVYAVLGEKDQAFELLHRAYEQRGMQMVSLQVDPSVDSLRSDPRFTEIISRMGFPQ